MNKVKKINFKQRLAAIILSVILVLSIAPAFSLIPTAPFNAFGYETGGTADFKPTELGIDNPQFANSSGALPAAPTGWTKTSFALNKRPRITESPRNVLRLST